MNGLRLSEDDPLVVAYYKKKKEEEERQKRFQQGFIQDLIQSTQSDKTSPKNPKGMRLYQAKGRLKEGQMNKTERRYFEYLKAEEAAGRIQKIWFESIKVKIADGACWYTPDFLVLKADSTLEFHEVKANPKIFLDDAKVKVKSTATNYPFKMIVVYPKKTHGWEFVEY
ncbi:hypothetical protein [Turicimonas sp. TL08]